MVILNPTEYVRWTQTTALYLEKVKDKKEEAEYEMLGALDEIGEIAGILKRIIRDDLAFPRMDFGLELGDLAWYLARIHYEHADTELDEDNAYYPLVKELDMVEEIEGKTCFEIGIMICEKLKKHFITSDAAAEFVFGSRRPETIQDAFRAFSRGMLRKDKACEFVTNMYKRISPDQPPVGILLHLASEIHAMDAVFDWCCLCYRFNYDILEVLQDNVNKLESRKERNTLHGKGSER